LFAELDRLLKLHVAAYPNPAPPVRNTAQIKVINAGRTALLPRLIKAIAVSRTPSINPCSGIAKADEKTRFGTIRLRSGMNNRKATLEAARRMPAASSPSLRGFVSGVLLFIQFAGFRRSLLSCPDWAFRSARTMIQTSVARKTRTHSQNATKKRILSASYLPAPWKLKV